MTKKKKTVKAWAVVMNENCGRFSGKIGWVGVSRHPEDTHPFKFAYAIYSSKEKARQDRVFRGQSLVVPCTITYSL